MSATLKPRPLPSAFSDEIRKSQLLSERERWLCFDAIGARFNWLKRLLHELGGNVEAFAPHQKQLWFLRQNFVDSYNRIGTLVDAGKRVRAYGKLRREIESRGR